ncbi:MAG: lycopene cyclase domain-containing protein [Chitinophagales bacterium]|jgi:lycopene cyclase domain-containing protein
MNIDTHYYYLLALIGSIFFPFVLSFDKKVNFKQYFPTLLKSLSLVALLFIIGDILYTYLGVWGFNENFHLSPKLVNLPLEEVGFFLVIPFACLFIYEVTKAYLPIQPSPYLDKGLLILAFSFAILAIIFTERLYTTATYSFTAIILFYLRWKHPQGRVYLLLAFLISILPFLIVNGFLTGMFTDQAIVWYNDAENLGTRIFTIPIEDFSYSFNLIALNILCFEYFKTK